MSPFAKMPPAMLQVNDYPSPPADDELDSPTDSLSSLSLGAEDLDTVETLLKPKALLLARPELNPRSCTDPSPSLLLQGYFVNAHHSTRQSSAGHRNRSPYSRSHLRSRSSGAALLTAPQMTRAHSLPNPHLARSTLDAGSASGTPSSGSVSPGAPHSPMRTPVRMRSPFREEGGYAPPRSPGFAQVGAIESIQEDSELDITPRQDTLSPLPQAPAMASFSRSGSLRRRPASPLHSLQAQQSTAAPTSHPGNAIDNTIFAHTSAMSLGNNSPSLTPQRPERFNEGYPSLHHYASTSSFTSITSLSSMPSTPTSARSRSPSISSLETLDEAPDMESEAVEAERIERLKLAAERQERLERGEGEGSDGEGGGVRRRSILDTPEGGGLRRSGSGFGFGRVGRERKRWSICGGERRGDLDLETIWED